MVTSQFIQHCRQLAAEAGCSPPSQESSRSQSTDSPELSEADSLIGFFQLFRPDGERLQNLFEHLENGDELSRRLQQLYQVAGKDRRPDGGRDAYFIVRSPAPLPPEQAEHHAALWIDGMTELAHSVDDPDVTAKLTPRPTIRVLEGIPPKPPKHPHEQSQLHLTVAKRCVELTSKVPGTDPHAELLRPAYYFLACDPMLRDYLMWPFYVDQTRLDDPFRSYFTLWSHGIKYRIFSEERIDIYLPRQ